MSRWDELSKDERSLIHHALRVLLTHPLGLPEKDAVLAKNLADELWDEFARRVASASRWRTISAVEEGRARMAEEDAG